MSCGAEMTNSHSPCSADILDAIRSSFPHFQDGAEITAESIRGIGREYLDMVMSWAPVPKEIKFFDQDGNDRYLEWEVFEDVAGWVIPEKATWQVRDAAQPTPDLVLLPRKLTAENGAKALLIGEFSETFHYMDDEGDECTAEIPVSWTTIKEIHNKVVAHFAAQPPAAPVETVTKSAPALGPSQNTAERLPSSDAAEAGADTRLSADTAQEFPTALRQIEAALRDAFPHFQDGSPITPEAIRGIGKEYLDMVMSWEPHKDEIEFADHNGTIRKIVFEPGDYEVGINAGWVLEDDTLDEPQTSRGITDIAEERQRQVSAEGWTPEHDDEHADNELALAALCYVYAGIYEPGNFRHQYWPWDRCWWKPADNRRNLVKAGALIAAEIDRLDRASSAVSRPQHSTGETK